MNQHALHNLFAAYLHSVPLEELIERVERARRDAQLRYVVIYGAACSCCLGRAERFEGSYLRTFALVLKEQLARTLAVFVTSILAIPRVYEPFGHLRSCCVVCAEEQYLLLAHFLNIFLAKCKLRLTAT